jgi:hypothetical protein
MQKRTWKWTVVAALALVGVGAVLSGLALAKKPTPPPPTPQPPPAPPIPYLMTYLGDLGGGTSSPGGTNANGHVTGWACVSGIAGPTFGLLDTDAWGIHNITGLIPEGLNMGADVKINDSGQIAATTSGNRAVLLTPIWP